MSSIKLSLDNRSVLRKVADPVTKGDTEIPLLIQAMWYAMYNAEPLRGVGLAAPQLGASKCVIVIDTGPFKCVILNPKITRRRLGLMKGKEGCLSYPGVEVTKYRDKQIVVEGFDENWKPVKYKLRDLESRVIQHEMDHLAGINIA